MKIDETVRRETIHVIEGVIILSVVMELCWFLLGWWNYTILLGNLLGAAAGIANFFLMGQMVAQVMEKEPEEQKKLVRQSQLKRSLMLFAAMIIAGLLPWFDLFATIIPILFPRMIIMRIGTQGQEKANKKEKRRKRIGL